MAEVSAIKESFAQLADLFHNRMAELQQSLDKAESRGSSEGSTSAVESDFSAFKNFVLKSLDLLQRQVELVVQQMDDMEMRSRRKMLVVHGVKASTPESGSEDTSGIVVEKLRSISSGLCGADIRRCHRIGKPRAGKPQPILVKLRDVAIRDELWFGKAALKGSGVTVGEFLTKPRHELFVAARERFGVRSSWSWNGGVFVLGADGKRHKVTSLAHLNEISVPPKTAVASASATKDMLQTEKQVAKRTRKTAKS